MLTQEYLAALDMATLKRDELYGRLSDRHGKRMPRLAREDVVAAPGSTGITLLPEDPSARCKRWREEGAAWTAPIYTQKLADAFKVSIAQLDVSAACGTWLDAHALDCRRALPRRAVRRPYLSYSDLVSTPVPQLRIRMTILGYMR